MKSANASSKAGAEGVSEEQTAAATDGAPEAATSASDTDAQFTAQPDDTTDEAPQVPDYRRLLANQTVKHWCHWGTASGFIPVPFVDTVTLSGIQVKMIYDLCRIYDVPFSRKWATAIVGAVAGGSLTAIVSNNAGAYLLRMVPVAGTTLAFLSQPAMSYASTYAFGTLFARHLEKGGTLGDFDFEKVKDSYQQAVRKASGAFGRKAPDAVASPVDDGRTPQPA